jgi:hypothetical protein
MMTDPSRLKWQDKVKAVLKFHTEQVHQDKRWTVRLTAKALNRSYGGVSQDLNLAYFIRGHPQLESIKNYVDAIAWMKEKKHQIKIRH